jgi:hypothetical protein
MANNIAFQPMGKTAKITANSSVVTNVQLSSDSPANQYLISNHDTKPVYVWISPSGSPLNVAVPTGGGTNASYAIVSVPGTYRVVTGPQVSASANVQVSVLSESANPEVYITPGEGL